MTDAFVSYAQNLEDVMLWRALSHVEEGFYIDVGAYSPTDDSVTRAMYERGWHGINIEPNPELHQQLTAMRTRDINLRIAIGDRGADTTIFFVSNPGLSTLDAAEAKRRAREGYTIVQEAVRVETLASVWLEHVPPGQPVHFLKVDVEGLERAVLHGNDWSANRPWIVLVEATRPMTTEPSYGVWEPILINAGYLFAYKDGINRFYVSPEHAELLAALEQPPNWFDGYVRYSESQAIHRAAAEEALRAVAEAHRLTAEGELAAVWASRSWTITRPLRSASRAGRHIRGQAARMLRGARTAIGRPLMRLTLWARRNSRK